MKKRRIVAMAVIAVMLICIVAAVAACKEKTYTVTFDSSGGSEVAPVTGVEVIEKGPIPTREGYDFKGWFSDPEFTEPVIFPYTVTADITLYAKWQLHEEEVVVEGPDGSEVFTAAKDGAVAFAAKAADAVASKSFNIGANLTISIDETILDISLAASVNAADSSRDQAKIQIDKNGNIYLGIYLYNNYLYVNDGTALRRYSFTGDGSSFAPDLAGIISDAVASFSGSGESVRSQFEQLYTEFTDKKVIGFSIGELLQKALSFIDATENEDGSYETTDLLASVIENSKSIGGIAGLTQILKLAGIDLAEYDDIFKTVLGYTFTEIKEGGFSKEVTPFADIRIGAKQAEDGMIEKIWLSRTLGESVMLLTLSKIYVEQGCKDVVDVAAMEAAEAGALHITAQSHMGETVVYTDIKLALDLNSQDGNVLVIKGGSAPGLNDYFTAVYDGATVIQMKKGQDTDGDKVPDTFGENVNTAKGSMVWQFTDEFCKLRGFNSLGLPDGYGMGVYFPALDLHTMVNTLIPVVRDLIAQLGGEDTGTGEGTGEGAVGGDTADSESGASTFDISQLIDRLIVKDGIGLNIDMAFIEGLINIDLWDTITGILPALDTVIGRTPDLEKLVTSIVGYAFEGKTAEQIVDDNSLDIVLSLPEGDSFNVGIGIDMYDKTRPEAGVVSGADFTIGFCDVPDTEGFSDYSVVLNAVTKNPDIVDLVVPDGESQLSVAIVISNNAQTAVLHNGNLQYYLALVSVLIEIAGYGGFM